MGFNHGFFVITFAILSGWSGAVRAQACDDHLDCARGSWCTWGEGADHGHGTTSGEAGADPSPPTCDGPDCSTEPGAEPPPEPLSGSCEPLPKGLCVDQTGCSTGLECVIPMVASECAESRPPATEPGTSAAILKQSDCVASGEPAPYGYCQLPVTACTTDAQCLPGLQCVDSQFASGSSGDVEPECAPGGDCTAKEPVPASDLPAESTCEITFDDCTDGTPCAKGYECVDDEAACSSSDSTGSGTGGATTGGSEEPKAVTAKQRDTTCEPRSACYPAYTPCTSDGTCSDGWVCTELEEGLPAWEQDGPVKTCLPRGLALAAEAAYGRVGQGLSASDDPKATGTPETARGESAVSAKDAQSTTCAVGFGPRGEGVTLLFMALAFLARRRTRRG